MRLWLQKIVGTVEKHSRQTKTPPNFAAKDVEHYSTGRGTQGITEPTNTPYNVVGVAKHLML